MPQEIHILMLAAGRSSRMGGEDKLMRLAGTEPLLRRAAQAACNSASAGVHVVLPKPNLARRDSLRGLELTIIDAPNAPCEMAMSIRAGVKALPGSAGAVIITLADMPDLTPTHYDALIGAGHEGENFTGHDIIRRAGTEDGQPGNPVYFPRHYFPDLMDLHGDNGAREILKINKTKTYIVPTPGNAALTDLDTPEAWQKWEASNLQR